MNPKVGDDVIILNTEIFKIVNKVYTITEIDENKDYNYRIDGMWYKLSEFEIVTKQESPEYYL